MIRKPTSTCRRRGGSTTIQTALTLSLLLTLTFGMVEFGYNLYARQMLAAAARAGARAGMTPSGSNAAVSAAVATELSTTKWPSTYYTVSVTDPFGNSLGSDVSAVAKGTQFQVSVSGTWSNLGAGFSPLHLISPTKTITAVCTMTKE